MSLKDIKLKIALGAIVAVAITGGAYYFLTQSHVTTENRPEVFATIDKDSLISHSSTPTISGTASADIGIFIKKGRITVPALVDTDWHEYVWRYWGHLGKCQSTAGDFCGFDILDGRWSVTVFGPGIELEDGVYTVIVTDSILGKDKATVLTTGALTVSTK